MKFCSYKFVLNEAPNNNIYINVVMYVGNIVLNEVPNSNDATRVANNVCLTTMGAQQFSMIAMCI